MKTGVCNFNHHYERHNFKEGQHEVRPPFVEAYLPRLLPYELRSGVKSCDFFALHFCATQYFTPFDRHFRAESCFLQPSQLLLIKCLSVACKFPQFLHWTATRCIVTSFALHDQLCEKNFSKLERLNSVLSLYPSVPPTCLAQVFEMLSGGGVTGPRTLAVTR